MSDLRILLYGTFLSIIISLISAWMARKLITVKKKKIIFGKKEIPTDQIIGIALLLICLFLVILIWQSQNSIEPELPKGIDPEYSLRSAYNNKGYTLFKQGKYEDALAHYDKAIEIDQGYILAWSNKGDILKALDRNKEANIAISKARDLLELKLK
jgi:tetratricopeptide (TPR) repeat protein